MEKHFKLTDETKIVNGNKLYRIEATRRSLYAEKKGTKGGFIQKLENLSDEAWVHSGAIVYGDARVYGKARVCGNAVVRGNAEVYGRARLWESAEVYGDAKVYGNANVGGWVRVVGNARIWGNANVKGFHTISNNAHVLSNSDYCTFQNFGSENRTTTFFKTINGKIGVSCRYLRGFFEGSLEEFIKEINKPNYRDNDYLSDEYYLFDNKEYLAIIDVVKIKFNLK